jgi:hypothetical protein
MTPEIIIGLIRSVLLIIFSSLLAKGTMQASTVDQLAGAIGTIVVVALSVRAKLKVASKVENLKTVVDTKIVENMALRSVVADSKEETGIMVKALIDNAVPLPALPPKPTSIAQLAADLHNQKMSGLEQLTAEQIKNN